MAKKKEAADSGAKSPKGAKKKPVVKAGASQPTIDTGLAAQSAAKQVAAGLNLGSAGSGTGPMTESAAFKNMKQGLSSTGGGLGGILDKTDITGGKKSHLPFKPSKQVGRNQTFGADVNRSGVPRRTGGG